MKAPEENLKEFSLQQHTKNNMNVCNYSILKAKGIYMYLIYSTVAVLKYSYRVFGESAELPANLIISAKSTLYKR